MKKFERVFEEIKIEKRLPVANCSIAFKVLFP